jgi:hypothetical protein
LKILDLLNLWDDGGLNTFEPELLYLLGKYFPVGWILSANSYFPGPGTIFTVVLSKTK